MALALVWLASAAYLLLYLRRGWVPHDEGTIAQSAARALAGELPHRDFVDLYSGALTWLNALSFRAFGETLLAPRITLVLFALAWIPVVYAIARRFAAPAGAALITTLALLWGIPNYVAALPSWYNLIFATFGLAALLRGMDTGRARWLALAGACGGISLAFKLPGLFFVAAGLLALTFAEQCAAGAAPAPGAAPREDAASAPLAYRLFLTLSVFALVALLWMMVRTAGGVRVGFHFVLPGAILAALLGWNERLAGPASSANRFRALLRRVLPFLGGFVAVVTLFAAPFALSGALGDLVRGVFVLPALRTQFASFLPPPLGMTLRAVAIPSLVLAASPWLRVRAVVLALVGCLLAIVLWTAARDPILSSAIFRGARTAVPLTVAVGAVALALYGRSAAPRRRAEVFAVLAAAAFCSLVQYPFSAPVYFCYVAPLAVLAVAAALSLRPHAPRGIAVLAALFYLAYAALWLNRGFIYRMGIYYRPDRQAVALPMPRAGGLRVDPDEARSYAQVVTLLQQHASGPYVYAGPDAPEVYFLAGYRNPTRQLFEFFDEKAGRDARLLAAVDRAGVTAVAINLRPAFTPPSPGLMASLAARYPHAQPAGKFVVRWK